MEATKKSREELGAEFCNDACPTADSYAMIFNSMLNFSNDGIEPPELGNPLIISTKKGNNCALIIKGKTEITTINGESIVSINEKSIRFLDKNGKIGIGLDADKNLEAILQIKSNNVNDRLLQFDTKTPWYFHSNNKGSLVLSCLNNNSDFVIEGALSEERFVLNNFYNSLNINCNTHFSRDVEFSNGIKFPLTGNQIIYRQQKKSATQFNINVPFFPQGFSIRMDDGSLSTFRSFLMTFENNVNENNANNYKTYASASYNEFLGSIKTGGVIHVPIPLEAVWLRSIELVNFTNQGSIGPDDNIMDPCTIIVFTNYGSGESVEKKVEYCSKKSLKLDFSNYILENPANNDYMKFLFIMVIKETNTTSGYLGLSEIKIDFNYG